MDKRFQFTEASVARLLKAKHDTDTVFFDKDVKRFGIRIRGQSRNYVVRYKFAGQERRDPIGDVALYTVEQARKKAKAVLHNVDNKIDPRAELAKKERDAAQTVLSVANEYLEDAKSSLRTRTHAETVRYLQDYWKPFHGLPLTSVTRASVSQRVQEIARERGGATANQARAKLSSMYSYAVEMGYCETNPVDGSKKAHQSEGRDRVLGDHELAAIWAACGDSDYGRIIKLLMLTGQRRNEIGGLRWSEVDMDTKTLNLPNWRSKNNQRYTVPLSSDALLIINAVPRYADRDYVFGRGSTGFTGWGGAKALLDKRIGDAVEPWTQHDLRRTAATRMAECGVLPHVIEAVANHIGMSKRGVAGIYNRATYEPEKRAALDVLANYIRTAIAKSTGANVTRLRGQKCRPTKTSEWLSLLSAASLRCWSP